MWWLIVSALFFAIIAFVMIITTYTQVHKTIAQSEECVSCHASHNALKENHTL